MALRAACAVIILVSGLLAFPAGADADALEVKTIGDVQYVSGGVGKSEREALEQAKPDYNLHLTLAHTGGAFLAGVPIKVTDKAGRTLLEAVSEGPYFYARLPAGSYLIAAEVEGIVQSRNITIGDSASASVVFYWNP